MNAGKILLTLSLHGRGKQVCSGHLLHVHPSCRAENTDKYGNKSVFSQDIFTCTPPTRKILEGKQLMKVIAGRFERLFNKNEEASGTEDSSELSTTISDNEDNLAEPTRNNSFVECHEILLHFCICQPCSKNICVKPLLNLVKKICNKKQAPQYVTTWLLPQCHNWSLKVSNLRYYFAAFLFASL